MRKPRKLFFCDYGFTPGRKINDVALLCEGERIISVGSRSAFVLEPKLEVYELRNAYVTPGFIDTHIHGAGGFDSSSAWCEDSDINLMSRILVRHGVTAFVPTVVSAPKEEMLKNLEILSKQIRNSASDGAEPVGIHIEGPFINPAKRGAQEAENILPVDLGFARELIAAAGGLVKRMTFAPELPGGIALTELLCSSNVAPSMGHSLADEEAALRAIDAGARCCTHLFNGMPQLQQRNITLAAVALTDPRVTVELIIDGQHIDPRMVDLACRSKLASRVVAISDAIMGAGLNDGSYCIGPTKIEVKDGFSRSEKGLLAGTTTMLDTGWHSLMSYSHMTETYSAATVSINPAQSLKLADRGELLPGKLADLAFFERESNQPLLTVRRGEVVYQLPDSCNYTPSQTEKEL